MLHSLPPAGSYENSALPSPAWMRAATWRPSIDVATLAALVALVIPRIFFIQGVRIRSLAALTSNEAAKAVIENKQQENLHMKIQALRERSGGSITAPPRCPAATSVSQQTNAGGATWS